MMLMICLSIDNFALRRPRQCTARRGTILVTTMAICFTLAIVVTTLLRTMSVEARQSANIVAAVQAEAIERGAEQYVMSLLNINGQLVMDPLTFTEDYFAGVPVGGTGWFFIVRPVYDDPNLPLFGLVDECSKLDINLGTGTGQGVRNANIVYNQLMMLPGMTEEVAAAIIDWQDTDDDPYNGIGAESDVYTSLTPSYYAKNQPFETVEELLMVSGMFHEYLWGDGTAGPLGVASGMTSSSPEGLNPEMLAKGWYDLLTVHAYSPPAAGGGGGGGGGGGAATVGRGLINVNTASPAVLYTLPNIQVGEPESIIAVRAQNPSVAGTNDTSWLQQAVSTNFNNYITGQSYRYSADILAVTANGRAFKRVRIVINAETTPVTIISRRDVTDQGWPLDPRILDEIVAGVHADSLANGSTMGGVLR